MALRVASVFCSQSLRSVVVCPLRPLSIVRVCVSTGQYTVEASH